MKKVLLLCMLLSHLLPPIQAQKAGDLDPTFGTQGILKTQFKAGNLGNESGTELFVQPDGRIISVAGLEGKLVLCRYNTDGSVDKTYGTNGYSEPLLFNYSFPTILDPYYVDVAMQPDGKVVIAWNVDDFISMLNASFLVRYNTDGSRDTDFGTVHISEPHDFLSTSLAIQPNGKILVGGYALVEYPFDSPYFVIARYNNNGTPDGSFGTGGYITSDPVGPYTSPTSIAVQSDGKIVVCDHNSAFLTRFKSNGDPDPSWGEEGNVEVDFPVHALVIQPDQKILVAGPAFTGSSYKLALRRFNSNGTPDRSFSGDGKLVTNTVVSPDGAFTVALQSNGRILASGTSGGNNPVLNILRFSNTGTPEITFAGNGKLVPGINGASSFTLLPDNRIGITGYIHNGVNKDLVLARYYGNGTPDPTLDGDGKAIIFYQVGYASFLSTALQKDGKLLALAQSFNGKYNDKLLTRYTSKGELDKTFSEDGMQPVDSAAQTVAIQPTGKIIVAGGDYFNSTKAPLIARYNQDGSPDHTFGNGGKIEHKNSSIVALAIHANGKIIVAGNGGTASDYDFAVTRYNSNGTLDLTYSNDGYVTTDFGSPADFAKAVAIQEDGKVVVSGTAFGYDYNTQLALARYNGNGTLDKTFGEEGKALPAARWSTFLSGWPEAKGAIATQPDGKIVVAVEQWQELRYEPSPVYHGITRLKTDGSLDESFAMSEYYGASGVIDFRLGANPKVLIDFQNGGIILTAGPYVSRYLMNGSVDPSFQGTDKGLSQINDIAIGNKRLYMVGSFTSFPQSFATISAALLKDNQPPVVNIVSPANNNSFVAPATINITALASDPDGTINKVEFYNGSTLVFTEWASPYYRQVHNVPPGTYKVTAKAYDNLGKTTTSSIINITVTDPSQRLALGSLELNQDKQNQLEGLSAHLEQNIPNPAQGSTLIRYYIPAKAGTAQLILTNLNGHVVQKFILNKGSGQTSINTSSLPAGTYIYSLYIDGKQADRKLLVIAR
ncbi:Ig-like domain-containing protein [Chitinophagaceae bacterium LB-8]|uniref:Ig-like domain-containing protein n=1 Tax=Paraflavisolibacter caeni TaxID=2982496 RepID=A0A9X2XWF4_9BACT|nr:Ig-like domain-containing protein [Paraflavisolibacter caeni]MCU7549931.1 Ig-like domain-containing protein [Paraflavisolibacter caeni]